MLYLDNLKIWIGGIASMGLIPARKISRSVYHAVSILFKDFCLLKGYSLVFSDFSRTFKAIISFLLLSTFSMAGYDSDSESAMNHVEDDQDVLATSASQLSLSMDAIHEALKVEIDKVMQISNEYEINLATQNIALSKQNTKDKILIRGLSFEPGTYHFQALLNTVTGQGIVPDIQLRGSLQIILQIPVVSRMIQPDEEITGLDISWQKIPLSRVSQGIVQTKDDLIGKAPRGQSLKPGIIVRKSDLRSPKLIKKNDAVAIIYRDEGLSLSSSGEALQDGAKGEIIRIMLSGSKRQIQARVKDKGQAEIQAIG